MKCIVIALGCVLIFSIGVVGQTSAPKPDPALTKLQFLVGRWTYDGEYKSGPLGPGAKIKGEYVNQMDLGGFIFEAREIEKGPTGELRNLEIDSYDPIAKKINFSVYQSDGSTYSGVITVSGNTVTWAGKLLVGGKEYPFREPLTLSPDLMRGTAIGEISSDGGKTWVPFFEGHFTKVKPSAKK